VFHCDFYSSAWLLFVRVRIRVTFSYYLFLILIFNVIFDFNIYVFLTERHHRGVRVRERFFTILIFFYFSILNH
jgi:hypothetical protein